ncbi:MAG TPA: endonuclease/exonuclease/phosphatase family protein [Chthonomonadales bacterium]|nr:endonuclease/exonuclease/phosphatase family protein [Chthonomonadales bacterium]
MRLVSYNIRGGLGIDGRRSLRRIAEVLREVDAQIICLQEVHCRLPWSGFQNQLRALARWLGMPALFQNNVWLALGGFGNALLTSLPVLSLARHRLPNSGERACVRKLPERRGLLEAVLQSPQGPLTVMVTHWSLNARDRQQSAEKVAALVAARRTPVLLAGDFNAAADSPEMARLRGLTGLCDRGSAPTFPAHRPATRIDYVLHSPEVPVTRVWVVETPASDHRPVVVAW